MTNEEVEQFKSRESRPDLFGGDTEAGTEGEADSARPAARKHSDLHPRARPAARNLLGKAFPKRKG